jgi:putative FmdB family regulatory protein
MPTYTYQCASCGAAFEQVQKFSDDPLTECPSCHGTVRRVIHPVGIVFKGSGWYITDSRKGNSASLPAEGGAAASADKPAAPAAPAPAPAKADS